MKILLVGNGLNLAMASDNTKYNVLEKHISGFLNMIGFYDRDNIIPSDYPPSFSMLEYMKWVGEPNRNHNSKKISKFYKNSANANSYDLELICQLYFASLKYANSPKGVTKSISTWINKIKQKVVDDLSSLNDKFDSKISKKISNKYDYIITTNYDSNLENSGISPEIIHHAHGTINEVSSIELVTFKRHQSTLEDIRSKIPKGCTSIGIDIFGISLFNEVHILKILFSLWTQYKEKLVISQYIFANNDREFTNAKIANLFLEYFYEIKFGEEINTGPYHINTWVLGINDQTNHPSITQTYLRDDIIRKYLYKTHSKVTSEDIKVFKAVFTFCKNIKVYSHTDIFLNELDVDFSPPFITLDANEILGK